jgi:hypothetical protein
MLSMEIDYVFSNSVKGIQMAKFKMRMKLSGLELELEGERSDLPLMTANIGQQFARLLEPASNIVKGDEPQIKEIPSTNAVIDQDKTSIRTRTRRTGSGASRTASAPIVFTHDESKWGNPLQSWNPTNKAIWLLYVVGQAASVKELSAGEIAATFNSSYKVFGKVLPSNISRDLGKIKSGPEALFVSDSNGSSAKWSLSAKGLQEALKLINEAKGIKETS